MMQKTILITGSTDGIGLETARTLVELGHRVLLHGRNRERLEAAKRQLVGKGGQVEGYLANLSQMDQVEQLASEVAARHEWIDVLINNAGVLKTDQPITENGWDVRFAVNTLAPCLLTQRLWPLLGSTARVLSLSSAAQAPVNLQALTGEVVISNAMTVYAQSKLALTMWSRQMALKHPGGPVMIAVNPGSLLATKMVREGFGMAGHDIRIGADILIRLALEDIFNNASGLYFDNDAGQLGDPHPDALDEQKLAAVVDAIEALL